MHQRLLANSISRVPSDIACHNQPNHLSFPKGAVLTIIEQKGQWYVAEYEGKRGNIPSNYVKMVGEATPSTTVTAASPPAAAPAEKTGTKYFVYLSNDEAAPADTHPASSSQIYVISKHPYEADKVLRRGDENDDDDQANRISFPKGAKILVTEQKPTGWWKGKEGYFPSNYVKQVEGGDAAPAAAEAPKKKEAVVAEKTNESSGNASNARVAELEKQNAELKAKLEKSDAEALRRQLEEEDRNAKDNLSKTVKQMNDDKEAMKTDYETQLSKLKERIMALEQDKEKVESSYKDQLAEKTTENEALKKQFESVRTDIENAARDGIEYKKKYEDEHDKYIQEADEWREKEYNLEDRIQTLSTELKMEQSAHKKTRMELDMSQSMLQDLRERKDKDLALSSKELNEQINNLDQQLGVTNVTVNRRMDTVRQSLERAIAICDQRVGVKV